MLNSRQESPLTSLPHLRGSDASLITTHALTMLGPRDCTLCLLGLIVLDLLHGRSSLSSTGGLALAAPTAPTAYFGWLTTGEPEWLPRNLTATAWTPAGNEKEERPQSTVESEKFLVLTQDAKADKPKLGEKPVRTAALR